MNEMIQNLLASGPGFGLTSLTPLLGSAVGRQGALAFKAGMEGLKPSQAFVNEAMQPQGPQQGGLGAALSGYQMLQGAQPAPQTNPMALLAKFGLLGGR